MTEFTYRPDIDGLRAIAVILVLLFHSGLGFSGGFVGVDVFFVISGYLITGLILKEQKLGCFTFSSFWLRRIRRIMPASTFVVLATLGTGFFVLLPDDYAELSRSTVAQQLMLSNIFFWRNTGYFAGAAEMKPLLHTWSLAVEEQFYIGYPFLLIFLCRYERKVIFICLLILTFGSFVASACGLHNNPSATFFLLPTRAWELLLGGLVFLAQGSLQPQDWKAGLISILGLAGIVFAAYFFTANTPFPGRNALAPCLGTACLILANTSKLTWIGRLLASKAVVFVGLISYSLYLWHWPLLVLMKHMSAGKSLSSTSRLCALAVSLFLATISWHFIETPFRRRMILPRPRNLLIAFAGTVSLLLCASLLIRTANGIPGRFDPQALSYASAKQSRAFINEMTNEQLRDRGPLQFGAIGSSDKCVIWGDSHAMALIPGLDAICKTRGVTGFQATHSATPPLLDFIWKSKYGLNDQSKEFNRSVVDFAITNKVDLVVLAGRWSLYMGDSSFQPCLSETIRMLAAEGVRVAIVLEVASQSGDIPLMLSMSVRRGEDPAKIGVTAEEYLKGHKKLNEMLRGYSSLGISVLDPASVLVDDRDIWRAEQEGQAMYRDSNHLSVEGSIRLKPMFEALFDEIELGN